jgi:hypothetical protein
MGKNKKNQKTNKPNQINQQEVPFNENELTELDKELLKIKEDTEKKKAVISEAKKILEEYKKLRAELELEEQQLKSKFNQQKVEDIDIEENEENDEDNTIERENENIKQPDLKEERFTQLLEQFNQNNEGFIEIYRIKENGMRTKIGKYPIKDVGTDIDFVAQKFGGGDYLIVLKDTKGRFQGQIMESYDEMAYPKPNSTPIGNGNPLVINTSQNESLAQVVAMMEKSFQQQLEAQKAMAQQLLEITKASVSSSPIKSLKDLVELKALLQEKDTNPLKNIEILMGLFTKGMEFGSTISQSNSDDDSFVGLIKDLIPMIISQKKANNVEEAKQYIQSALKINQPQNNQNPPQILEQKTEPNQIEYKGDDMKLTGIGNLILNLYRGELIKLAKVNYNPQEVADMILLKLPQDYYGIALDIAKNPDRLKIVCEYLPELKEYEKWVEAVLDSGKDRLIEYFKSLNEEVEKEKEKENTKSKKEKK